MQKLLTLIFILGQQKRKKLIVGLLTYPPEMELLHLNVNKLLLKEEVDFRPCFRYKFVTGKAKRANVLDFSPGGVESLV